MYVTIKLNLKLKNINSDKKWSKILSFIPFRPCLDKNKLYDLLVTRNKIDLKLQSTYAI